MLHRFLFVAGMTVGVMTPLVWMAYASRPALTAMQTPAVETVNAAPNMAKPVPAQRMATTNAMKDATKKKTKQVAMTEDVTASIPHASTKPTPAKPASVIAQPDPNPPHPVRHAELTRPHAKRTNPARPQRMARDTGDRIVPAVVSSYNGAHIIIVCAALTVNEQLRAGCP